VAQPPSPRASTRRAARAAGPALCALLFGALLIGCSSGDRAAPPSESVPRERPIRAPEPLPDSRHVALEPVIGRSPVFPVSVHGGELVMGGAVTGPGGAPVADAVVRLERFVGQASARLDVRTNTSGRWVAIDVHGGRYRIRAWRAPDLAMTASEVRFIAADAEVDLTLPVDRYDGADVTGDVDDDAPEVGATATVTVLATRRQVDPDGIVTTRPAAGRDAVVSTTGPWELDGEPETVIDDAGRAAWRFTCRDEGPVSARVAAVSRQVVVTATCVAPAEEPPSPPPVDRPDPDFPVGSTFTPPFAGPIPAGTYAVVDDPGTCGLTYQAWTGGAWDPARRTITGTGEVTIPQIARDLQTLGDSPPCTYERLS
jgi:hypothetical protein